MTFSLKRKKPKGQHIFFLVCLFRLSHGPGLQVVGDVSNNLGWIFLFYIIAVRYRSALYTSASNWNLVIIRPQKNHI